MSKSSLHDLNPVDIILEQDMTAANLANHLRQAYFDVEMDDDQEDQFIVLIHKHKCIVSLEEKRKAIRLSMIDYVAGYDQNLYAKLIVAANEANASLVNVASFMFHHEIDGEDQIMLRVDQYISYHTALILPQFVRLLRQFEDIDVEIFFNIIKPVVDEHEEKLAEQDQLWN